MIFIIRIEIRIFKKLANEFMSWKDVIELKNEILKTSKTLYRVDKEIRWRLMINFLISYIFESRTLSLSTLKFIFIILIISLLLKIDNVNSILNNFISGLIDFISNLIDFLLSLFWNWIYLNNCFAITF